MLSSQGVAWSYQLPGKPQEISFAAALPNPNRWHLAGDPEAAEGAGGSACIPRPQPRPLDAEGLVGCGSIQNQRAGRLP